MQDEELRDLYQAAILDHARAPRNLRRPDPCTHEAFGDNPLCGDQVTVWLRLTPAGEIEDAGFTAAGCAIAIASASLMTEALQGCTDAEARRLAAAVEALCGGAEPNADFEDLQAPLARLRPLSGVRAFPMRVRCVTLAWQTMVSALDDTKLGSDQ